jgi:hypothetical protein
MTDITNICLETSKCALFLSSLPVENSLQGPEHGLQPCCPAQYQAPQSI